MNNLPLTHNKAEKPTKSATFASTNHFGAPYHVPDGRDMLARIMLLAAPLFFTSSALAEELGAQQSWDFVAGKLFAYTCYNGATGEGRILDDGSVAGTLQLRETGQTLFRTLPPGTIGLDEGAVCAHIAGLPMRPCFTVQKIDATTFRGSVAGLDFAYCLFRQVKLSERRKGSLHDNSRPVGKPVTLQSLQPSALY